MLVLLSSSWRDKFKEPYSHDPTKLEVFRHNAEKRSCLVLFKTWLCFFFKNNLQENSFTKYCKKFDYMPTCRLKRILGQMKGISPS